MVTTNQAIHITKVHYNISFDFISLLFLIIVIIIPWIIGFTWIRKDAARFDQPSGI